MSRTEQLLEELLFTMKEVSGILKGQSSPTCSAQEALKMLGRKDSRILTALVDEGHLNRTGGGKGGYTYFKQEVLALVDKIRSGSIKMPNLKQRYAS